MVDCNQIALCMVPDSLRTLSHIDATVIENTGETSALQNMAPVNRCALCVCVRYVAHSSAVAVSAMFQSSSSHLNCFSLHCDSLSCLCPLEESQSYFRISTQAEKGTFSRNVPFITIIGTGKEVIVCSFGARVQASTALFSSHLRSFVLTEESCIKCESLHRSGVI